MGALVTLDPQHIQGATTIVDGEPSCRLYEDVVYDPAAFGLFDSRGDIISLSAFRRGTEGALVRSHAVNSLNRVGLPEIKDTVAYLGGLLDHFGHFVCTSLSRMWAWERLSSHRALFHGWPYTQIAGMGVARLCFGHHGLNTERVLQPSEACLLKRVIIPGSAFDEQSQAYTVFRDACLRVGCTYHGNHATPVYLSKAKLIGGVQRITNEIELEDELASAGVEIVHPEELSMEAQIGLFSSGATVLGSAGSAFHTQVFAERLGKRIVLAPSGILNSNQILFDGLVNQAALYVVPTSPSKVRHDGTGGSVTGYELVDPRRVAQDLVRLI